MTSRQRLAMLKLQAQGVPVKELLDKYQVSRKTFYKWRSRHEKLSTEKTILSSLTNQPRGGKRSLTEGKTYHNQLSSEAVNQVLDIVKANPSLSVGKVAQLYRQREGVTVGHHGIQNLFKRHNLSHHEDRVMYASAHPQVHIEEKEIFQPQIADVSAPVKSYLFSPNVLPGPPPEIDKSYLRPQSPSFSFITTFSLSAVTSGFFSFLSLSLVDALLSATSIGQGIGLLTAALALMSGMFFFLYSVRYYLVLFVILLFSRNKGQSNTDQNKFISNQSGTGSRGLLSNFRAGLSHDLAEIEVDRQPFVSIHIPLYNEKRVVNRLLTAVTSFQYENYEVVVCDDSTDETKDIVLEWKNHPRVKISHRENRSGFKGGALKEGLKITDPGTEFVIVFDADFLPYPDSIEQFLKYFKASTGSLDHAVYSKSPTAAVQGYQWHVLNKSENWVTRGVRSEYAGSYVIERSSAELYGGLKQIAGSVFMIRADVLRHYDWGTSITEDFELTLRLYRDGYKVVYTPYIQTPSECVSTVKRLIRQRMRWAEGHSFNVKKMFWEVLNGQKVENKPQTSKLSFAEKLEFLYLSPYYLQSALLIFGSSMWFLSEVVFQTRLPFWTAVWGWSLVLTNFFALPLMNMVGMFLEEAESRDYGGTLSFIALSYIVAPFQGYAALKGFFEKEEGPWFRTPKTGKITDSFTRTRFFSWIGGFLGSRWQRSDAVARFVPQKIQGSPSFNWSLPKKRASQMVIVTLLIFTTLMSSFSRFVPIAQVQAQATLKTVQQTDIDSEDIINESSDRVITQPILKSIGEENPIEYGFHPEPRVRMKYQGSQLEMQTVSGTGVGKLNKTKGIDSGSSVVYKEIFDGVDLRYKSNKSGLTEDYIVKEYVPIEAINSRLQFQNLKVHQANGVIEFIDPETSEVLYSLLPPFMYEQTDFTEKQGISSIADLKNTDTVFSLGIEYELKQTPLGWQLSKKLTEVGKKWLAHPDRKFPIVIDPSVIVSTGIVDGDVQFGAMQRKIAYVNGNWYAFHNDGGQMLYKKSADGVSWGSNVDVDATEADTDNYNGSIWVDGTTIWVAWIDDSSEDMEFRSIDTANSDTLGTKCTSNLGAITIDSTNIVTITRDVSTPRLGDERNIFLAMSDSSTDTEEFIYEVTTGCTFTDITTGSGIGDSDQPLVLSIGDPSQQFQTFILYQDGDLSYSIYSDYSDGWVGSNVTVAAVTDASYSAVTDGTTVWVLSQSGTTATNFYRIGAVHTTIDNNVGGNRSFIDIDCPTSGDCKMIMNDFATASNTSIIVFLDCNDADCDNPATLSLSNPSGTGAANQLGQPVAIDCIGGVNDCKVSFYDYRADDFTIRDCTDNDCSGTSIDISTGTGRENASWNDIYCVSAGDCSMLYYESGTNDLQFVHCTDGTGDICDTVTGGTLADNDFDTDVGVTGGPASIYCPAADDCKVVYYDGATGDIVFADCSAADCSSATITTTTIDSDVGTIGERYPKIDCAAGATECRIVYFDGTDGDITFVDCNASATCATPTLTDIDTDVGTNANVELDCNDNSGSPDDCKIIYSDSTDEDLTFYDCSNDACSAGTPTDIDTSIGKDIVYFGLDCTLGVTDCQVAFIDKIDNVVRLADCNDGTCSAPTLSTPDNDAVEAEQPNVAMACPSVTDCKLAYHDVAEGTIQFVDCNDATCSAPTINAIATVGRTGSWVSMYCPAADNCKLVFHDKSDDSFDFVDCNDATCSAPTITNIDTINEPPAASAIYCPASDNCKIVYNDTTDGDITFIDCPDEACTSTGRVSTDLNTNAGGTFNGMDIDCPASDDCKVVYTDDVANALVFDDCTGDEDCSTNTTTNIDADIGAESRSGVSVDCSSAATDCQVSYFDETDDDVTVFDCNDATCSAPSATDIDTDVGSGAGNTVTMTTAIDCAAGADNCKLFFNDKNQMAMYFSDCSATGCTASTTYPINTTAGADTGGLVAMDCTADGADCKLAYADPDSNRLVFVDCISESCIISTLTAPWTSETNILSVSLTYDSTNDDLYAHIVKDATEQAYFKSTDAQTISWNNEVSYGFTAGDINHISSPMSYAGTAGIGVTVRQGANYEFATLPENYLLWLLLMPLLPSFFRRLKYSKIHNLR